MSKIMTVFSGFDLVETKQVQGLLEENGIPTFLKSANTSNLFGLGTLGTGFNLATGAYELEINEVHLEKSLELIKQTFPEFDDEDQST